MNSLKFSVSMLTLCLGLVWAGNGVAAPTLDDDSQYTAAAKQRILPPDIPWQGKSQQLVAAKDNPFITVAEASDFRKSGDYNDTVAWLNRLASKSRDIKLVMLPEKTPQGRQMVMAVVSSERNKSPEGLRRSGKPTVYFQSGIHSGEINGKDAGLMLLRDLLVDNRYPGLLDKVNLLFVPSVNPDGEMRRGPHNRINQNGPDEMGSRLNANNLNLNRDFTKLDSAEIRNVAAVLDQWQPSFFADAHSTDGLSYQYDATYCDNGQGWAPAGKAWMDKVLHPHTERELKANGHIPNVCISMNDPTDVRKGYYPYFSDMARFSNQYADIRGIPAVLIEMHSIKPYQQQVLGNYILYKSFLEAVASDPKGLAAAIAQDQAARPAQTILAWKEPKQSPMVTFKGVKSKTHVSPVTGSKVLTWTNQPQDYQVPMTAFTEPDIVVARPRAYIVSAEWQEVIAKLKAHGIKMTEYTQPQTREVTLYRVKELSLGGGFEPDRVGGAKLPVYEGRLRVNTKVAPEVRQVVYPAGSVEIATDQPLGTLATALLEPESPDSFLSWGFFNTMMGTAGDASAYVMEPMAKAMLKEDPKLAAEFKAKLKADPKFAKNPQARLNWFFERTAFIDSHRYLYPVAKIQ